MKAMMDGAILEWAAPGSGKMFSTMTEKITNYKWYIICLFAGILIGFIFGYLIGSKKEPVVKYQKLPAEVKTETKTEIQYIPKEVNKITDTKEKTDVEVNIPKPDLHVKVNGHEAVINKATDEKYIFDENKLQLNQQSYATVDLKIPTIDNTRKWTAGVGYSNHGAAGTVKFPIYKQVGGWVYGDKKTAAAGIMINF